MGGGGCSMSSGVWMGWVRDKDILRHSTIQIFQGDLQLISSRSISGWWVLLLLLLLLEHGRKKVLKGRRRPTPRKSRFETLYSIPIVDGSLLSIAQYLISLGD